MSRQNLELKKQIEDNLGSFAADRLKENALKLFETLGLKSDRNNIGLTLNNADGFKDFLSKNSKKFHNEKKAHLEEWETVDFLFQLTDEEIRKTKNSFNSSSVDTSEVRIESYLFFAVKLKKSEYVRSKLAEITREVNRIFPMPVMILFQHGSTITFSIIDRRLHKRDTSKDVLQKATLIKDIRIENPHRAHIEILENLALQNQTVKHFVELHEAWKKTLDTKELNKGFFKKLADWYFWAVDEVVFPKGDGNETEDVRNATGVIRLITRVIFVWFLKEKGLVSDKLFDKDHLKEILNFKDKSAFYKAILQNLFFATLNSEMGARRFIAKSFQGKNQHHFVHNVFRYRKEFTTPDKTTKELFEPSPFLNGGLFECLDKEVETANGKKKRVRVDGFSDHPKNVLEVPDELFFGDEREINLNNVFVAGNKKCKVEGLIRLLNSYKFTVAENTPIEEEVALDPELLGKVFENLLANYNPETQTTARKQTGSFYTPREIVNYMVDESLMAYLKSKLEDETASCRHGKDAEKGAELETALRRLFSYTDEGHQFNEVETKILIKAISECRILDPACGSGAFPMGALLKLVHVLQKLDPENKEWMELQFKKAIEKSENVLDKTEDEKEKEKLHKEIYEVFKKNSEDYGRKLYLIENCIYGVDIQPIAVQISKLRFFISLIVDQQINKEAENLGIRPLPNLETKFIAANTLIGLETNGGLKPNGVLDLEADLKAVRAKHFDARTRKTKEKYRGKDKQIRAKIAELLKQAGFPATSADQISDWNPYDQNSSVDWFDAEYMFGIEKGFDIVIGNPPYLQIQSLPEDEKIKLEEEGFKTFKKTGDIYCLFYEKGNDSLKNRGFLTFITSNKWLRAVYGRRLRKYLSQNTNPIQLIDFGQTMIFENAIVHSNVIIFQKFPNVHKTQAVQFKKDLYKNNLSVFDYFNRNKITVSHFSEDIWSIISNTELAIKRKIEAVGIPLKKWSVEINRGILTGLNKAFIIDERKKNELTKADLKNSEIIKPILRGRDVRRYYCNFAKTWLINSHNGLRSGNIKRIDIPNDYPKIYQHLLVFREKAKIRADKGAHWTNLRNCAYLNELKKPKIIFSEIVSEPQFYYDEEEFYPEATVFFITGKNLKYLTALLNSNPVTYFFRKFYAGGGLAGYRYKKAFLENLPIPKPACIKQLEVADIADEIIEAKKKGPDVDTSKLESEIDKLVYRLYGLTDDEIAIIEGKE